MGEVLDYMQEADNNVNIVIIDACRDNPYYRKWRSTRGSNIQGLVKTGISTRGTIIAYATEPEKVAADGKGEKHSPFTESLLKHLDTPSISVERMFKNVTSDVYQNTNNEQFPWTEGAIIGDFSFNPTNIPLEVPKETTVVSKKPTVTFNLDPTSEENPVENNPKPKVPKNWNSTQLAALAQNTIGLYPMPGVKAQQKADKVVRILQQVGFKGTIRVYQKDLSFFDEVNYDPSRGHEIRFDEGLESEESSLLKDILDDKYPELNVELLPANQLGTPTYNLISIFFNNR